MAPLGPKALAKLSLGKSGLPNVSWEGVPTLLEIPPTWHHTGSCYPWADAWICCCIAPIFILWDLCGDANGLTQAVSLKLIDSFTCQIRQGIEKLKMCPLVTRSGFYSWLLHVWRTLLLFWLDSPWGVGPTWDPALEVGFRDTRKMLMGRIHHHAGSSTGWAFTKRNSGVAAAGILAPFHLQGIYSNGMTCK